MKAQTAKQVLIATKWILTHFDWCQGAWWVDSVGQNFGSKEVFLKHYTAPLKCACLDGALDLVESDDHSMIGAQTLLRKEVGDYITWNDEKGRTKKQVIALLNKLIKKAP
jgi:hypothetical protein